ncbi:MAG: HPP family protein [Chloroflexi bacterium]|nr:HPP family protein [Chloroflexota bacterium]
MKNASKQRAILHMGAKTGKKSVSYIIDSAFLRSPKPYIVQSLLAVAAAAVILTFLRVITHTAIIAALGSSTFIVFALPNTHNAQPRCLIGGHIIGLVSGLIAYLAFSAGLSRLLPNHTELILAIGAAFSIGLAIFLMTITDTEHPPAAGTALGIIIQSWSYQTIIFILAYAVSLALVKWLLKDYLKNLA